ncbi:hypothetical protein GNI_134880 [Gregarina niphandrodes]|uniref:Uncharacterized protein n=1 Tax=Gregarina niphandrodes TaxID=110365 RepID=A0A023B1K6_GRENI|nr:hypothetical protein GNI_134880 [Gregarina niphandrodes]EZG46138.1 hypothetical protein GNI_134880 [Gregarina niphandrodes]|eukprot:XP_011132355.1 hypothetical protein GNI_134880 [Gregarina niphandrodes]
MTPKKIDLPPNTETVVREQMRLHEYFATTVSEHPLQLVIDHPDFEEIDPADVQELLKQQHLGTRQLQTAQDQQAEGHGTEESQLDPDEWYEPGPRHYLYDIVHEAPPPAATAFCFTPRAPNKSVTLPYVVEEQYIPVTSPTEVVYKDKYVWLPKIMYNALDDPEWSNNPEHFQLLGSDTELPSSAIPAFQWEYTTSQAEDFQGGEAGDYQTQPGGCQDGDYQPQHGDYEAEPGDSEPAGVCS